MLNGEIGQSMPEMDPEQVQLLKMLEGVFSKSYLDTPVRKIVPTDVYCRTTTAVLHNIQRPENREER